MLVIGFKELIATAEEGINTSTESLINRLVILAWSTTDLAPLFLHRLDLLDCLIEGCMGGKGCRCEHFLYLKAQTLFSLEVLLFSSLTLVMELLVTLMLCRSQLLKL